MAAAYIDTSALAKWYLSEPHSGEFAHWIQHQQMNKRGRYPFYEDDDTILSAMPRLARSVFSAIPHHVTPARNVVGRMCFNFI